MAVTIADGLLLVTPAGIAGELVADVDIRGIPGFTLDNYAGLAGGTLPFATFFVNTAVTCLATAVLAVAIATPAA